MTTQKIDRLCVIGVGLIGGSFARDLRDAEICQDIVGCGRQVANLRRAVELGVIDTYETDIARAVARADLVFVSVPLGAMSEVFARLAGSLADGAVVTDAGSAKRVVLDAARQAFGRVPDFLVPGHPIAGTEHSGVDASQLGLYRGRRVILTPEPDTRADALNMVRTLWEAVGADVIEMPAHHHDEVLAATSHLPHMLAFTLVDVLGGMEERVEMFRYAAGGFRDFTRIASSDPQMWHDICLANGDQLASILRYFMVELEVATQAIERGDGEAVKAMFARAKKLRDKYASE